MTPFWGFQFTLYTNLLFHLSDGIFRKGDAWNAHNYFFLTWRMVTHVVWPFNNKLRPSRKERPVITGLRPVVFRSCKTFDTRDTTLTSDSHRSGIWKLRGKKVIKLSGLFIRRQNFSIVEQKNVSNWLEFGQKWHLKKIIQINTNSTIKYLKLDRNIQVSGLLNSAFTLTS